jgi:mono/diheme cytochrome c family protein
MTVSRLLPPIAACFALAAGAVIGPTGSLAGAQSTGTTLRDGAYLTGPAGQCSDCHRPGLTGGPNEIPGPPGAPWAKVVPSLRGLKMFKTNADAIAFLHTAILPGGMRAKGPMPGYHFSVPDATAIVVYLRSLK